jgi:hypothetical protein
MLSKKQRLQVNQEIILIEVGYCNDTSQLNKIEQKHHQHIGLLQALSMAGFRVAFVKDVHCIPLGFGGTVVRNLHALLRKSFKFLLPLCRIYYIVEVFMLFLLLTVFIQFAVRWNLV